MKNENYRTSRGHLFGFSDWPEGESPLELFDKREWLKCLHSTMFVLSRSKIEQIDIEDDGILHELIHLSLGVDICTHQTLSDLREQLELCLKR